MKHWCLKYTHTHCVYNTFQYFFKNVTIGNLLVWFYVESVSFENLWLCVCRVLIQLVVVVLCLLWLYRLTHVWHSQKQWPCLKTLSSCVAIFLSSMLYLSGLGHIMRKESWENLTPTKHWRKESEGNIAWPT